MTCVSPGAFCEALEGDGVRLGRRVFGRQMDLALVDEEPATILLEA